MFAMGQIRFAFALVITSSALWAQQWAAVNIPLTNWTAPQLWSAPRAQGATAFNGVGTQAVGATAPLQFVAITPCRVVDTRAGQGFTGTFGPPALVANTARIIPIPSSSCGVPSSGAYSLNFTVVPPGPLVFLSAWPDDQPFPNTSVLNAPNGGIVANGAVIPSGADGGIQVRASNPTDLIIDINGYYTPQLSLALGSAAAPTLTFAGDSTSGLYSSGTGTVSVATGGINRLTVASNGNVGIGTATPGSKLDVAGDVNLTGLLQFKGNPILRISGSDPNQGGAFDNVSLGVGAFQNDTTGGGNTAVGDYALKSNTAGFANTAIGYRSLEINTTGTENVAVGEYSLRSNSTGFQNVAVGTGTLFVNGTGFGNTAVGDIALTDNTTGSQNTGVGTGALFSSNGNNNIGIGYLAGYNVSSTSNNIHIGHQGLIGDSGAIRIGTSGVQASFFAAGIRGTTTSNNNAIPVVIDSNGQLGTVSSSRRFKDDIQDMGGASRDLMRLRPVTFRYKKPFADGSKPIQYGLIAEEVAEVYPDLVARSADGQIETVKYQVLDSMLLNEVQRQQKAIGQQRDQIRGLEQQNQDLQRRLARLEAALASVSAEPRVP